MKYKIYYIKCKTNDKGYVGITSRSIKDRWSVHLEGAMNDRKMSNGKTIPFMAAINKYGPNNFTIKVLEIIEGLKNAYRREKFYIKRLRTYATGPVPRLGYNCTMGGENTHRL